MKKSFTRTVQDIRKYCLWCTCGISKEIRECPLVDECPLFKLRLGKITDKKIKLSYLLNKINENCIECSSRNKYAVPYCTHKDCDLHKYIN